MRNPWKKLSSKIVHKNPWYLIRQDQVLRPDGKRGTYTVVEQSPAVYIVAMNERNEVAFIGLYRYTTNRYSFEIPAGGIEEKESPLQAAKRELKEETGFVAKKWKQMGKIQMANGFADLIGYFFLATELKDTKQHRQREEGIDQMKMADFQEVFKMIKEGAITDGPSIVGLTFTALELKKI